jgi:hypothetical protein|uniref:hypothetical protein n=1 Tax=Rhizobium ruizarguesonis TaxID=2081791 RepID=UPI001FEE2E8B|nr:hypothetical protein [Rhizobium ruizarguesonis]
MQSMVSTDQSLYNLRSEIAAIMPDPTSDTLEHIHERIAGAAPSGVWSRADFPDIATPNAVEKALQSLTSRGDIRHPHRDSKIGWHPRTPCEITSKNPGRVHRNLS